MKRCSRCQLLLPVANFSVNRAKKDGLQDNCRECQRQYLRDHYTKNVAYYVAKAKAQKAKQYSDMRLMLKAMKSAPCEDCGRSYPYWVMDFDHVTGTKNFGIARALRTHLEDILAETKKCQIVCANCHRERTQLRRHWECENGKWRAQKDLNPRPSDP